MMSETGIDKKQPIVLSDSPAKTQSDKKLKQATLFSFALKTPTSNTSPKAASGSDNAKGSKTAKRTGSKSKSEDLASKKPRIEKCKDPISEGEVSSSDQNNGSVSLKSLFKGKNVLDNFVRRETMQQDEVSTSNTQDLPDQDDSFILIAEELTQAFEPSTESAVIVACEDKPAGESVEFPQSGKSNAAESSVAECEAGKPSALAESPLTPKPKRKKIAKASGSKKVEMDVESASQVTPTSGKSALDSASTPEQIGEAKTPKSSRPRKPTPKQSERKAEIAKKKEEREKIKLEKEQQKADEKAEKERLRKEKLEEKEKQKQAELDAKAEKEKKKEEERLRKEEERLRKEEELAKKEEEKRQKEEEKRKQEEQEQQKKEKAKQAFQSFFTKRKSDVAAIPKVVEETEVVERFKPFRVKENMRLAPMVRSEFTDERKARCDSSIKGPGWNKEMYLAELKAGKVGKGRSVTVRSTERKDEDVEILEDECAEADSIVSNSGEVILVRDLAEKKKMRWKLLQFCENRRPAYWGTWTKKSPFVAPRRPIAKDQHYFDYEVDSDDEWEEEEPGESLSDSEGEQEPADDYEVDNEFFVPHGYLSDEEAEDEMEDMSPEARKEKLKRKEEDFEKELKKRPKTLKPTLIGCFWESEEGSNQAAYIQLQRVLGAYRAIACCPLPVYTSLGGIRPSVPEKGSPEGPEVGDAVKDIKARRKEMPEEDLVVLVRMIHGCRFKKDGIIKKFLEAWDAKYTECPDAPKRPPKTKLILKIREIANYGKCVETSTGAWIVNSDVLKQLNITDLPELQLASAKTVETPDENKSEPQARRSLITQYTQSMTPEEVKKQHESAQKKRVSFVTLTSKASESTKPEETTGPRRSAVISLTKNPTLGSGARKAGARPAETGDAEGEPPAKKRVPFVTLSSPQKHKSPSAALMDRFLNKKKDTNTAGQAAPENEGKEEKNIEFVWIDD